MWKFCPAMRRNFLNQLGCSFQEFNQYSHWKFGGRETVTSNRHFKTRPVFWVVDFFLCHLDLNIRHSQGSPMVATPKALTLIPPRYPPSNRWFLLSYHFLKSV